MKKWSAVLILFVQTLMLTALTLFCVVPVSCKVTEEGIIFVGGDYDSPVLEELNVLDEKTVVMSFSEKIKLRSLIVSERLEDISDSFEHSQTPELSPALKAASGGYGTVAAEYEVSEDGYIITCSAVDHYEIGKAYEIFGAVDDKAGNSLTFCIPFTGYNSHLPKLVMTEVQVKYKKYKDDIYRCEYVEFLALTEGNLSGFELVSAADGEAKKFEFPPQAVKVGEVILVHLRSAGTGCITETDDLNASAAAHSGKNVRDIWAANEKARLSDSSDVIVLRNGVNGKIYDAIMYCSEDAVEWGKNQAGMAEKVFESGIYESSLVSEAEVNSGLGSSAVKAFCRTDATELQKRALEGENFEEPSEYPVKRTADTWVIKNVSPGML